MAEVLEPVAPPSSEIKEKVIPAVPGVASSIAKVELIYPERFQQITADISNANDPKARMRIADNVEAHDKETAEYRPNQRTQWDKVLVNVLSRNYNEALKWFNGGGVVEKEARDLNNNLYFREENDFGYTGRIKDREGKFLSPEQIKKLDARGGIFSGGDRRKVLDPETGEETTVMALKEKQYLNALKRGPSIATFAPILKDKSLAPTIANANANNLPPVEPDAKAPVAKPDAKAPLAKPDAKAPDAKAPEADPFSVYEAYLKGNPEGDSATKKEALKIGRAHV